MTRRREVRNPDPNRHYHWTRGNDAARIQDLMELYGYRIEKKPDTPKEAPAGEDSTLFGAITAGGDILLSCPREEWEQRQKDLEEVNRMNEMGPMETFKTEAKKLGVQVEDKSRRSRGTMSSVISEKE